MKIRDLRVGVVAVAAIAGAWTLGCGPTTPVEASFTVEGMTCESCSSAITAALEKIDGVESASADHVAGSAIATYRGSDVTPDQLAAEIEGLGYTVTATETGPAEG